MNRRRWCLGFAAAAVAACTYKEYNTYYEVQAPDAGAPTDVAGAGGSGQSGAAGASTSGTGGAASGAGGTGGVGPDCAGCLRLTMSSNAARNLRLEFDGDQNLSQTQLVWRMRVRGFTGDVSLNFYAQSGSAADEQMFVASVNLSGGSDWQELGADFGAVQPFSLPQFTDAGGAAGGGFDPGFPFDKSEVERIGVIVQPNVPSGVFTPLTIEIDSVTFSNRTELSTVLSSNGAGFELVEADGASIDGATLVHVGG
jgi:hypothetical protein